jgi:glycosyltransferase involved in cell wall biosynthesis
MSKAKLDLYLSEMAVSNLHGGGLTLQRVIGDDLDSIDYFAHVSRMAYDLPATEKYQGKDTPLISFWDSDLMRKIIGRTRARDMSQKPFFQKLAAKRSAKLLNKKFNKDQVVNVLVCPQGTASVYTLEALKKYRPVKYITWVMDDHVVRHGKAGWFYPDDFEEIFARHLQEAAQVFTISPVMQAFYRDRFGVEAEVLFGSVDRPANMAQPILSAEPVKVGYFGAVAAWQLDALKCFADALASTDAELHIYSGIEQLPAELVLPAVHFKGRVEATAVLATMQQYHAVLLPISFLEKMRNMSELNIATKMSEYLASGVPIFSIGPDYAAMIKYLKQHNAAIVVDSCDKIDIQNALKSLSDRERMAEILGNALALSEKETGTRPMYKQWLKGLNKLLY